MTSRDATVAKTKRNRLVEFAVLLPFVGAFFVGLPVLWRQAGVGVQGVPTSNAGIYLFGVWFGMILLAAVLAWRFGKTANEKL